MPPESKRKKQIRAKEIFDRLSAHYGEVICTLDERFDAWRLLVAAVLAAQCTDARVNTVTPALFHRFPQMCDFAKSSPEEIEPYIRPCGFFRNKAKAIHHAAIYLLEKHAGEVPEDMEALLAIPGVGRKIANLLRGEIFGKQALVVDTHCMRLAQKMGFSKKKIADAVEKDLLPLVPEEHYTAWGHYMVEHGRAVCRARNPQCKQCLLGDLCPSVEMASIEKGKSL